MEITQNQQLKFIWIVTAVKVQRVFAYFSYRLLALSGYDRWGYDVILNWGFKLAGENPWNGHSITVQPINQWQWGEKWGSFSVENFDTGTYNASA